MRIQVSDCKLRSAQADPAAGQAQELQPRKLKRRSPFQTQIIQTDYSPKQTLRTSFGQAKRNLKLSGTTASRPL